MAAKAVRDKKIAVGLILLLLLGFYVGSVATEYVQSVNNGYGSGFSNQYHVAQSVIRQVSAEDHIRIPAKVTASQLSNMTLGDHKKSAWNEIWRWTLTVLAFALVLGFWYVILSRLGTL